MVVESFPFIEVLIENKNEYELSIRYFDENVSQAKLSWHKDKENRSISILKGNNIFLQIDTSATGDRFYNLDEESISEIITNSIEQWNDHSNIAITPQYTNSLPPVGESATLRFTENPAYFGSGVLAVTTRLM